MALDREKAFKEAERLLRAGRFDVALVELRRLAEDAPRDVLSLNRSGDLLAKFGRPGDALGYYDRVADQYAASGFFPKAVAILKKSQKIDPERPETFARLGDMYLRQKLTREARVQLLHAAERFLKARRFADARLVYERLVSAEPGDPRHRVRLAETRAAEGDTARAVDEFLAIGASLLASGGAEDAERAYRRASELAPARPEPVVGLASAMGAGHRQAEAIDLLRGALARFQPQGPIAGELLLLLMRAGRTEDARALLAGPLAQEIPDPTFERLVEAQIGAGRAEPAWELLDPLLATWRHERRGIRVMGLLERLSRLEPHGHLPALERLVVLHREPGRETDLAHSLPRLAVALRASGQEAEARAIEADLGGPSSPPAAATAPAPPAPAPPVPSAPARAPAPVAGMRFPPEAPAIPLTPLEEEFVAGQLTEAEVLQNYGLGKESADRLRAVVERFPGHVQAQTKLADLLRSDGDRPALKEVLVELALARRAAGDEKGARRAAEEAGRMGPFPEPVREVLVRFRLLEVPASPRSQPPPQPQAPPPKQAPAQPKAAAQAPAPAPVPSVEPPPPEMEDADVEIVFDDDSVAAVPTPTATPAPSPAPAASAGPGRAPRRPEPDVLEEIAFYVEQGMSAEAGRRIGALRTLGYGGEELDALEERAAQAGVLPRESAEDARLDEEALRSLTESLDSEMAAAPGVLDAEAAEEQSLADVFAAFKRQVEVEVGGEDFRTHYDLGIAYKEMGLLDDALEAFRTASGSADLFREASSMAAMVHVEKGDLHAAAAAYRLALESPGPGSVDEQALRYALAEVLLQAGETEQARELFRGIVAIDPGYRDAEARLAELEAHPRG